MSRKRTALEYLIEEYQKHCDGDGLIPFEIIELAKDMEKDQIKSAYNQGYREAEEDCCKRVKPDIAIFANAEGYFFATYMI
jgi:hypothetical protein